MPNIKTTDCWTLEPPPDAGNLGGGEGLPNRLSAAGDPFLPPYHRNRLNTEEAFVFISSTLVMGYSIGTMLLSWWTN